MKYIRHKENSRKPKFNSPCNNSKKYQLNTLIELKDQTINLKDTRINTQMQT